MATILITGAISGFGFASALALPQPRFDAVVAEKEKLEDARSSS